MVDKQTKEFYENMARVYPEEILIMSSQEQQRLFNYICTELDALDGSLIEFGCGKGRFTLHYAKTHPDSVVYGLDLAPTNIKVAKQRAKIMGLDKVQFEVADLTELLEYTGFSNLICIETIEHIFDLGHFVENVKNATKLLGTVVMVCPYQKRTRDWTESNEYLTAHGITEKYYHCGFTVLELKQLFQPHGFKVIKSFVYNDGVKKSIVILKKVNK